MDHEIVPLITCDDGTFELHEPTLEWFSELKKPFGIISCAGKFRTGKSFLLNRILNSAPSRGFGVGETVQACTKGLWICKKTVEASEELDVIIMDTEGIDALDASSEHDTRIFTLGILLSSIFLYNSVGHIDEAAIQTLSFMSKVSELIDCDVVPPKFCWILRDFSLQMVDKHGSPMTNKEYLEYSLNEGGEGKSGTRDCIKTLFKERELYTLPRPSKTDTAQNLNKKHSNLNPKFMSEMGKLRESLLDDAKPICAAGKPMSGPMFVKMCRILVEKVKSSQMPVIKDAWSMLRELQHNDVYRKLIEELETETDTWEKDTFKNLKEKGIAVENEYIKKFETEAMSPFESSVYTSFNGKVSNIIEKAVENKKVDMQELVKASMDKITMFDKTLLENVFEAFYSENGSSGTCEYWVPEFLSLINSIHVQQLNEYHKKGEREAKEELNYEITELQTKYKAAMEELEHEKEQVMQLKSEVLSLETPSVIMIDSSTSTDPMDSETDDVPKEKCLEDDAKSLELKLTIEDLTSENDFLKSSIDACKAQMQEIQERVEVEVEELKVEHFGTLKEYEALIETEKSEKDKLSKQCIALEERVRKQSEENGKLDSKNTLLHEKFLDFYNKSIEEMRKKESEARQYQSDVTKEILGVNRKLQEEKKTSAVSQTETLYLKRQLEDFESLQKEHKRVRRDYNEVVIEKTRHETDLSGTKSRLTEISRERDVLRKTNMQLENKVAVLETTGIVNSCKKTIVSK